MGDEDESVPRFWDGLRGDTRVAVDAFLEERFPVLHRLLSRCLEDVDPIDIVYPDNPGEYKGVVRELLVLLWSMDGPIETLSEAQVQPLVEQALSCYFPDRDEWEPEAASHAARLITASARRLHSAQGGPGER